jgi:hypothetical protein
VAKELLVNITAPAVGFVSEPLSDSEVSRTLTTYLGLFLREAEALAGPRDLSWTPIGIEFFGDVPESWYPGNCHNVAIRLSVDTALHPNRALFQLAHEVVHLLSPSGKRNQALNLEEGFAAIFSREMLAKYNIGYCPGAVEDRYRAAHEDVRLLLTLDAHAIKKVRQIEPRLWKITPEIVTQAVPQVDAQLAARLCRNWYA